ncbi:MAG: hypothetical protein ACC631_02520 [Halocynthiibacter sp.]
MKATFALVLSIIVMGFATAASASKHLCPDPNYDGAEIYASATELYAGQRYDLRAGGDHDSRGCYYISGTGERVSGYFTRQPDFELNFYKNANYKLMFRVQSDCDSVLLINTGAGNWYWDDDDAGNLDAQIYLTRPSAGWYDIWIGTVGPENCDASLYLETFK